MELATIMAMRERRSSANVKSELRALPVLFCCDYYYTLINHYTVDCRQEHIQTFLLFSTFCQ